MQVTINIPDELAAQVRARGLELDTYVSTLMAEELLRQSANQSSRPRQHSVSEAIDSIRILRKGNFLGGLKMKDLIHEGHKY